MPLKIIQLFGAFADGCFRSVDPDGFIFFSSCYVPYFCSVGAEGTMLQMTTCQGRGLRQAFNRPSEGETFSKAPAHRSWSRG